MTKVEVGEIFTISDDENEEGQEVEVLGVMTLEGTDYVAVGFVEDILEAGEEDIDIFFLKVDEDGDFSAIESDEEFDKVVAAFEEMMEAEEDEE
ncbi:MULTISPECIES: DUF1292 domain-containing protein [Neobacillus]|uniref:DUF1292 domain-containing protein n=1 Tax=Neobacillus rhizophilus TaxID=2833579 RepID=A0A942U4T7_9BACI|nr:MULTISPECIES: DUF1292 domain-containing protein [Neobacillus]MBS4211059.1 DUF1292 domain-containing protein [Neobacillus rhizophilus]MBU8917392.1 DUF1292 domain-containing protein [Bacillus sp. FJAT-29953]